MDTILLSIEYYGNFWRKETYFCGIVYHDRVNTFSLFIVISEEKKDIQKKKRVVLKKGKGIFQSGHDGEQCGNICLIARRYHRLTHFQTQICRISVNGRHELNRC